MRDLIIRISNIKGNDCTTVVVISICDNCFEKATRGGVEETTTTPSPSACWQNGANPCNKGLCSITSYYSSGYFCVCPPGLSGILKIII